MVNKTTTTSPAAWRPDLTAYVTADIVPDTLILTTSTVAGSIEGDEPSVRVPFVSDDGTANVIAEAADITDSNPTLSETVVQTDKVAWLGKFSYELLAQPNAAQLIVDAASRSIANKANALYLGNAANPTGLLNVAGITDGGTVGANLDTLTDAVAAIEADGGQATHIIAAPSAWAALSKLKTGTNYASTLLGAGTEATERSVLSVPVIVSHSMPTDELLVLDKAAVVSAVGDVRVARSDQAYFSSDVVAVRVTLRLGWGAMRPKRVAKLTTAATVHA